MKRLICLTSSDAGFRRLFAHSCLLWRVALTMSALLVEFVSSKVAHAAVL